jgi:hypothetical protein
VLAGFGIGIASAIAAIVLIQLWRPRCFWSKEIAQAIGAPSGEPLYQVRLGRRRRRASRRSQPRRRHWPRVRWRGIVDVSISARVVVTGLRAEHRDVVLPIPVSRAWRPVIEGGVNTFLRADLCARSDLRYFPPAIVEKHAQGVLNLHDLLGIEGARLRVYAFCYTRLTGARRMIREQYTLESVRPGHFDLRGRFVSEPEPPILQDLEPDVHVQPSGR